MTVEMIKTAGTWTVGWNSPGHATITANTIEYPNFEDAWKGFGAILKGEGGRQVLTAYQRFNLEASLRVLDTERVEADVERNGGQSFLVGRWIFWIAKL
jgi:hypothetical protein